MENYLGEIRMVSFNYAPHGWATCDGQLLPIAQNSALYALLGTTYGGNGTTTFALPDLRGRTAMHQNVTNPAQPPHPMGQMSSEEAIAIPTGKCDFLGDPQAHDYMLPFGVVNYIIALTGIYPSRP